MVLRLITQTDEGGQFFDAATTHADAAAFMLAPVGLRDARNIGGCSEIRARCTNNPCVGVTESMVI